MQPTKSAAFFISITNVSTFSLTSGKSGVKLASSNASIFVYTRRKNFKKAALAHVIDRNFLVNDYFGARRPYSKRCREKVWAVLCSGALSEHPRIKSSWRPETRCVATRARESSSSSSTPTSPTPYDACECHRILHRLIHEVQDLLLYCSISWTIPSSALAVVFQPR